MTDILCECGHDLGQHPPDPAHPFAWPCRACDCHEYRERAVFATQGGGYAIWSDFEKCYVWHSDIPDFLGPNVEVGDPIPEEWGVAGPVRS